MALFDTHPHIERRQIEWFREASAAGLGVADLSARAWAEVEGR